MKRTTSFVALLATALVGCGGGSDETPEPVEPVEQVAPVPPRAQKIDPEQSRVSPATSCADHREAVVRATALYLANDSLRPNVTTSSTTADSISRTNIQEEGVDEADIIKADSAGNLYVVFNRSLIIVDALPAAQMAERARVDLDLPQSDFLLFEDRQRGILISSAAPDPLAIDPFPWDVQGTYLTFIDLSDLDAPQVTGRLWVSGLAHTLRSMEERAFAYFQASLAYDYAYEFQQSADVADLMWDYIYAFRAEDGAAMQMALTALEDFVRPSILDAPLEHVTPKVRRLVNNSWQPVAAVDCADIYHPQVSIERGLGTAMHLAADGSTFEAVSILTSADQVYVSPTNLYVGQSSQYWWWTVDQADQTAIHQFSLQDTAPAYVGSGVIDGGPNNRFAYGEHNGFLRVATTQRLLPVSTQPGGRSNHLFVLQSDGGTNLTEVAAIRDFKFDESIFSVRFAGDTGYVVTFEIIDPLFAFDLTDPFSPQLAGQLEIPGFSTYMHPVADHRILTVGRGDLVNNVRRPIRVQLFDVADLADPRLLHAYDVAFPDVDNTQYQWSSALSDARAFNFIADQQLLTLPVYLGPSTSAGASASAYDGYVALEVDDMAGITELSRVDHDELAQRVDCEDVQFADHPRCNRPYSLNNSYRPNDRRTVVVTEGQMRALYTLSDVGIKATPVDDATTTLGSIFFD